MPQTQEQHGQSSGGKDMTVEVIIHGNSIRVKIKKDSTFEDLIAEVIKVAKEYGIDLTGLSRYVIRLNDKLIKVNKDGKVAEEDNETIEENAILVLMEEVRGGYSTST